METYKPISCDFHDELEAISVQKKPVEVVYKDERGGRQVLEGRITDLYTRDHEEFMIVEGGVEIRLDQLVMVDGKPLKQDC